MEGFEKNHDQIYHHKQELFEKLSHHQEPQALFVTCSDSHINPHLITQSEPGDLFVLPNADNRVPPYGSVEKSRQLRSRHFSVLTYSVYAPRAKMAVASLDGLF